MVVPGCKGDGIHDDTEGFTKYILSCQHSEITIPKGKYLLKKSILIKRNDFTINGSNDCIILCDFPVWTNPSRKDYNIQDEEYSFVLDGDNLVLNNLNVANVSKTSRTACAIRSIGNGFGLYNSSFDEFDQGVILGSIHGHPRPRRVYFSNVKIIGNKITNIKGVPGGSIMFGDGICFFGYTKVEISNNLVTAKQGFTPRNGIAAGPEGHIVSSHITYNKNQVLGDWDYPVSTEGARHCTISNNEINGRSICSIIERGRNVTVIGNKIIANGRGEHSNAIHYYGVDTGKISNNLITGKCSHAIHVRPTNEHETVAGNDTIIENNTTNGEFESDIFLCYAIGAQVKGNNLTNHRKVDSTIGINIWYSTWINICENTINVEHGLGLQSSGGMDVGITNNTMIGRVGLYIGKESNHFNIENNNLQAIKSSKFDQSHDNIDIIYKVKEQ